MSLTPTRLGVAIATFVATLSVMSAGVAYSSSVGIPVATTLDNPRGLAPLANDEFLLAEAGAGRVWRVETDGSLNAVIAGLPVATSTLNGPLQTTGVSAAVPDGSGGYFAVVGEAPGSGFSTLYAVTAGLASEVLDLAAYEAANNSDGRKDANGDPITESNPIDVAVDDVGAVYVTDSKANAVIRHTGSNTRTFFAFPQIANPLFPQQGPATIDQMPTGITIGPDGAIYVATFTADPYPQGEARVYRLEDKNSNGHARDAGEATVFATGLTTATDLAFDDKGRLWVSEYSTNLLTKQPGRISRVLNGVGVGEIFQLTGPTSIAFTDAGRLLVTEQSVGRVADVSSSTGGGGFTPQPGLGVTITTFGGGPVDQLSQQASDIGVSAVAVTSGGKFIVLVPGAPAFVNQAFRNHFPSSVPAGTAVIVVR